MTGWSEALYSNISKKVNLTDSTFAKVIPSFTHHIHKKKVTILKAGEVCHTLFFVTKGSLRSYSLDGKGVEHVVQLALEDHWIADLYSFLTRNPSTLSIDTIEATEVLSLSYEALDRMYLEVPLIERFFRKLLENAYAEALRRLNAAFSESAESRYKKLLTSHPDFIQRIPLIYISSYLGITPESLSRIRKNIR